MTHIPQRLPLEATEVEARFGEDGRITVLSFTWRGRKWPVLSHGLLYVCQNTRDGIRGTDARLLCYDLRAGAN